MRMSNSLRHQLSRLKGNVIHHINRVRSVEAIFQSIYRHNGWGDGQSVSGTGSNIEQTAGVRAALPRLFRAYDVRCMLDIPCGDFNWMQHVDLSNLFYLGADIVRELIASNRASHEKGNVKFLVADITKGPLPQADLVLCRDCLVHLSDDHAMRAIRTIIKSDSRFLLTTTFPKQTNIDIVTGSWRPLNLQDRPFLFPPPVELINEGYHGADTGVSDKSLGLWRVSDLRNQFS